MNRLTLSQAAIRFGGTLVAPDCRFSRVSTDSRTIEQGDLFVALRGERFDGHKFLSALSDRAGGAVVETRCSEFPKTQWVVPDTVAALGQLAMMNRDMFAGPLVAMTGSSGKTTVKEMTAAILQQKGDVISTRGNLNNHLGVPLTLLRLDESTRFAVIEMGASAAGEIAYLCQLARPDVVLVNNVMPAHVEGFGSVEGIAQAKGEIFEGVNKSGVGVINLDEPYADQWRARAVTTNLLTFSVTGEADFRASDIRSDADGCCAFVLHSPVGKSEIKLSIPGRHNVANALAAAACAYAAGAGLSDIEVGLESVQPVSGRMQRHRGRNGAVVIDDTYNANPGSMKAAIDVLAGFEGKRIFVMGDMAELGSNARKMHRDVGAYAKTKDIESLFTVGPLSKTASEAFGEGAEDFDDKSLLASRLSEVMDRDTVIVVKGSRSAAMEQVVQQIVAGEKSPQGEQ
ncbi:MAG: UDP-N-acetylmuramoyl-tripeptide--D-alanyl-D-alanine ligase [bacterium]